MPIIITGDEMHTQCKCKHRSPSLPQPPPLSLSPSPAFCFRLVFSSAAFSFVCLFVRRFSFSAWSRFSLDYFQPQPPSFLEGNWEYNMFLLGPSSLVFLFAFFCLGYTMPASCLIAIAIFGSLLPGRQLGLSLPSLGAFRSSGCLFSSGCPRLLPCIAAALTRPCHHYH